MSNKVQERPKLKASIGNEDLTPKFSPKQLNGLLTGLRVIRSSNIKNAAAQGQQARLVCDLPAKVDYWLGKNESAIDRVFKECLKDMDAIIEANCLQKTIDGQKFIVYQGKDESDVVLEGPGGFYKETTVDEKPQLEHVALPLYWEEIITPAIDATEAVGVEGEEGYVLAVEAKEAVAKRNPYQMAFISDECKERYTTEMPAAENDEKYALSLYQLDAANLEGIHIAWPNPSDPRNNLEEFRKLLFEHAIVG